MHGLAPSLFSPCGGSVILWRKFGDSRSKDSEVSTDSELAKASEAGTESRKGKLPGPVSPLFNWVISPKETTVCRHFHANTGKAVDGFVLICEQRMGLCGLGTVTDLSTVFSTLVWVKGSKESRQAEPSQGTQGLDHTWFQYPGGTTGVPLIPSSSAWELYGFPHVCPSSNDTI